MGPHIPCYSSDLLNHSTRFLTIKVHDFSDCPGFGWNRVNFPRNSWYGAVFFSMRIMLIIHWCFRCCRALLKQSRGLFSFLCCPDSEGLGVHKELAGDRNRTADPDLPKGYSIPCGVMQNNKTGLVGSNHNSPFGVQCGAWRVEITDLTKMC